MRRRLPAARYLSALLLPCLLLPPLARADEGKSIRSGMSEQEAELLVRIGGAGGPSWLMDARPPGRLDGPGAMGPACLGLDEREGTREFLEKAARGSDDIRQQAYQAATSAIADLPWLTLRRALPEVADLFDAELARAEEKVAQVSSRCQRDLQAVRSFSGDDGGSNDAGWTDALSAQTWQQAGRIAATPSQAENMLDEASQQGIAWLQGEKRGGQGQKPIQVLADTTATAATLLFDRTDGFFPWDSPQQAAEWMVAVLGDIRIRFEEGGTDTQISAGGGLWPYVLYEQQILLPQLAEIVERRRQGKSVSVHLERIQAARLGLQHHLMDRLSRTEPKWQSQVVARVGYELAMVNTLDKALLARQLLAVALQLPEVAALPPARSFIAERLSRLEQEVQSLLFEYRARKNMGETLSQLWRAAQPKSAQ